MALKIGINGFGRIGRSITRRYFELNARGAANDFEIVGINDLTSPEQLAFLLSFDSVHGRLEPTVQADKNALVYGDQRIAVSAEKDPASIPWRNWGVDLVLECTGLFTSKDKASAHLKAGAKRVIISAPGGEDVDGTFCYGVNTDGFDPDKHLIISNASCTTNCLAPVAKVLQQQFGIAKGHMVTVHSYTNDQRILDLPHKDLRRARAAALSMIPTTTGAARAIGLVLPELKGKLDGTSIRVPTPDVSLVCLSAVVEKKTSVDEVNRALKAAAAGPLKGVLAYEERPLVSMDYVGSPYSSIIDAAQTQVVGGDLVEVNSWYDNEWGFACRMVDMAALVSKKAR